MNPEEGRRLLDALRRRWRRRRLAARGLEALAVAAPLCVLLALFTPLPRIAAGSMALIAATLVVAILSRGRRRRGRDSDDVTRHLDRRAPELEDSTELLTAAPRNLLESLQQHRLLGVLAGLDAGALLPWHPVTVAARLLVLSLALSAALWTWAPALSSDAVEHPGTAARLGTTAADELPALRRFEAVIEPPAYTGRPRRTSTGLDFAVEEGSRVSWRVEVGPEVESAELVFDQETVLLEGSGGADTPLTVDAVIVRPRLYHLRLTSGGGHEVWRSSFARLEVIADAPPSVEIRAPEAYTEIDAEAPGRLRIVAEAYDDYGLAETAIRATLAAGSGEMVEFREERLAFSQQLPLPLGEGRGEGPLGEGAGVRLVHELDLVDGLGMKPGMELYFFVEAFDQRRGEPNRTRTATHVVRMPGERGRSVAMGEGIPMLTLPEYFRSQRQIIIDTEKLITDRDVVATAELEGRSQNLGIDQGALRLRYGTLLGLEYEDGSPAGDHDHDHGGDEAEHPEELFADSGTEEDPGEILGGTLDEEIEPESDTIAALVAELPEGMMHSHDSVENATFFTSKVKDFLKGAIAQMWQSELHLRLYEPTKALPFQYRALRLLKLAQAAERVYVRRIGFEAPLVKPDEKRLTGELDDIESQRHRFEGGAADEDHRVRQALRLLRDRHRAADFDSVPLAVLEAAAGELTRRLLDASAADHHGEALEALDLLSGPLPRAFAQGEDVNEDDLATVERVLWRLLPEPPSQPTRRPPSPGSLYSSYRARLGHGG